MNLLETSPRRVTLPPGVRMVLELPAGQARALGLEPGVRVLPPEEGSP